TPLTIAAATGVLKNDTDADGGTLAVQSPRPITGPSHGTLTLNADGSFTYTPVADYYGADTFTYKATDSVADSNVATVTINVTPVNDAPANLVANSATINENDLYAVSGSFTDVDAGDTHTVTIHWADGSADTVINLAAGVFT